MKNLSSFVLLFCAVFLFGCSSGPNEDEIAASVEAQLIMLQTETAEAIPANTSTPVPTDTPVPEPTIETISIPEPTVETTPVPEPTIEPTPIPESTTEPEPVYVTYTCEGEEEEFAEYRKERTKITDAFSDEFKGNNKAAYTREMMEQLAQLAPPACMKEWHEVKQVQYDWWADWLESTNDKTFYSTEILRNYIQYLYDSWSTNYKMDNLVSEASVIILGENLPRYDQFYVEMRDGEFTSDNFIIDEACDDMTAKWGAIQGSDGGYVHVELVNYDTGETYTIVNEVLNSRWDSNERNIKDIEAGEYFVRSDTYPTWVVSLFCEREWEVPELPPLDNA